MVSLLYVHARRTGWKIRPRPKTVILKIKMIQTIQNDSFDLNPDSSKLRSPTLPGVPDPNTASCGLPLVCLVCLTPTQQAVVSPYSAWCA